MRLVRVYALPVRPGSSRIVPIMQPCCPFCGHADIRETGSWGVCTDCGSVLDSCDDLGSCVSAGLQSVCVPKTGAKNCVMDAIRQSEKFSNTNSGKRRKLARGLEEIDAVCGKIKLTEATRRYARSTFERAVSLPDFKWKRCSAMVGAVVHRCANIENERVRWRDVHRSLVGTRTTMKQLEIVDDIIDTTNVTAGSSAPMLLDLVVRRVHELCTALSLGSDVAGAVTQSVLGVEWSDCCVRPASLAAGLAYVAIARRDGGECADQKRRVAQLSGVSYPTLNKAVAYIMSRI